jgi:hypothetical protein
MPDTRSQPPTQVPPATPLAPATPAGPAGPGGSWEVLRARVRGTPELFVPPPAGAGICALCRGPVRGGHGRCFHCNLHAESAPDLLADAVTPIAYARKGGPLARDLWVYKSALPQARQAATRLLTLLLVYLHDHGRQAWRPAGPAGPTHACVVPSGRGRPGPHPLKALVSGYLRLPWARLDQRPGADAWGRCLDPERFRAPPSLAGARVLLLDDTWVSGAAAQSAAVALKRAGCRSVATLVLGRHVAADGLPAGATRWWPVGQ